MAGTVRLKLFWDTYKLPYEQGTHISFPEHIKDIIKSSTKEIGGVILFEKPPEFSKYKLISANSIFLSAGEIDRVDFTHILTSINNGSYMVFHTHPKRANGYNGYSSQDLRIFFGYNLLNYKNGKRVHFCLSTGNDIHFTFIDPVVMKIIRTVMKLMKPSFIQKFPGAVDNVFEESFIRFFGCMLDALEHEFITKNATIADPDVDCLSLLDTITFTPLDKYDYIKGLMTSFLRTPRGHEYITNPYVMSIYEMYEDTFNKLLFEIPLIKNQSEYTALKSYLGLFKTTSQKYELFFSDLHGGQFSGVQCLDGGRIYDETTAWSVSDDLPNIGPLSPFAAEGGSLKKKTRKNKKHIKNRNGTTRNR